MATSPDAHCRNCGSPLYGEHCYACGQPTKGLVRHFGSILGDFADTLLNVDGRLLRTLPALLLKPGFLTREYVDGHRVRYVSPVRLFVFLCIGTFFAAKLASPSFDLSNVEVSGERGAPSEGAMSVKVGEADPVEDFASAKTPDDVEARRAAAIAEAKAPPAAEGESAARDLPVSDDSGEPTINFNGEPWDAETNPLVVDALPDAGNRWLNAQIGHIPENWKRVREDPDLLRNAFYSALPTALFLLVPVFALLLKVLYVYKRRLYMEHLVAALHAHAFVCAMLLVLMAVSMVEALFGAPAWLAAPLGWLEWLAMLWVPVYLWLHLKRLYGQGWLLTTINFALLGFAELMLLSVVATGALVSALVWL
jgi:hypothetical protein